MRTRQWLFIGGLGVVGGLLALGPALAPGGILHLDFVLLPHAPVPSGFWGLGPELPRRTPMLLPLAWLDPLIGSVIAGKALAVASLAGAFAGACNLARAVPAVWRASAGLLYALSPFALTRLAVGHLFVLAAMAILPWVAPWLLNPRNHPRRVYLGAFALALTGVLGGVFALVLAATGSTRLGGWAARTRMLATALVAQAPWLAPGLVVWLQGANVAGSRAFSTDLGGVGGPLRLLAGQGFWQRSFQVGGATGLAMPVLGVVVALLALLGHRRLDREVRTPLAVVAAISLAWVLLSGTSATAGLYERLTSLPGGAALREGQRAMPLFLLWAAPAAALGGGVLADRLRRLPELARVLPTVAALALVGPVLWGAGGQLRSTQVPADWERARDLVRAAPGTVLALPWFQYLDLEVAGGARVLNPLPLWLGGDVLTASNPRLPGGSGVERDDPREASADALVAANLRGTPVSEGLAALGVRWIVVLRDGDLIRGVPIGVLHATALAEDAGLRHVLAGRTVDVFEVLGWRGQVVETATGAPVAIHPIVGPIARLDASGKAIWARPGAGGWLRGWSAAHTAPNGLVVLPAGSGWVWYWPSSIVLISYIATLSVVAFLCRNRQRRS